MSLDSHKIYRCGDLIIDAHLGEIKNNHGDSVRLGPINTQVLVVLLDNASHVLSRSVLFDTVWKNQIVNDDTLTRCISDIRAHLSNLSNDTKHIETLPKRGYRWTKEVIAVTQSEILEDDSKDEAEQQEKNTLDEKNTSNAWLVWLKQASFYLVGLFVVASLGTWLLTQLAESDQSRIAIMPTQSPSALNNSAKIFNDQITELIIQVEQLDILSKSAIDSRPSNPFPYFFYEFGARWVLESELSLRSDKLNHVVSLVDARTGIVIIRQRYETTRATEIKSELEQGEFIGERLNEELKELINYLESEGQI